jgi:hypothetical protein
MTPGELLDAARRVLHEPGTVSGGWPRMVALLTRQALEKAIDEFWDSRQDTAGLSHCKRRTQLVCLPFYLDARLALEASYVWAALSDACHYHAYELAPTAGELARWIDVVAGLIESIDSPVKGPG